MSTLIQCIRVAIWGWSHAFLQVVGGGRAGASLPDSNPITSKLPDLQEVTSPLPTLASSLLILEMGTVIAFLLRLWRDACRALSLASDT